jgi:hypothetical protein
MGMLAWAIGRYCPRTKAQPCVKSGVGMQQALSYGLGGRAKIHSTPKPAGGAGVILTTSIHAGFKTIFYSSPQLYPLKKKCVSPFFPGQRKIKELRSFEPTTKKNPTHGRV